MIEDKNPPALPERTLVISLGGVSFTIDPELDGTRSVLVHLQIPNEHLGLAPGLGLAFRMSPDEARKFAVVLDKKAAEAEAAGSRRN